MAVKEVSPQFNIMGSTSVSGSSSTICSISGVLYRDGICYQINVSGNPTGYININASADYSPGKPQGPQGTNTYRAGNWVTLCSTTFTTGFTPMVFDITPTALPWTQVQVITSSGSGVVDVWVSAKSY